MTLNLDMLIKDIVYTEDFKELYSELKRMIYFLSDYKIVSYTNTNIELNPIKMSPINFLEKIVPGFQKQQIFGDDKDEAIHTVNHFIFTIVVMCYIWDMINEYRLKCNGGALIFDENRVDNPLAITYTDTIKTFNAQVEIAVEGETITGDPVKLIIKIFSSTDFSVEDNYLNKVLVHIWNNKVAAGVNEVFTLSNLNTDNLRKLFEKAAALKK